MTIKFKILMERGLSKIKVCKFRKEIWVYLQIKVVVFHITYVVVSRLKNYVKLLNDFLIF